MGRKKNTLTATQRDIGLFVRLKTAAFQIGARQLSARCNVSHETIYKYCRGEAVAPGTEEQIQCAIEAYRRAKLADYEVSKEKTRAMLSRIEEGPQNIF